ncbi:uncharacterized protein LOC115757948 [Drosophila novamexicana]|uniref:uncharacterized protein LOC115757948 n=1 Tax=Drosophila novamexicana TaxID=47314 RepID=UPI0011E5A9A5|nr:uncharacterized protein LOC115757948 [Drosophila novamexicana]
MDIRFASEPYADSGSAETDEDPDQATNEEDLKRIDETIQNISRNLRKGDWTYLGRHPEIRAIIRVIVTEAIKQRPENIFSFAADLFNPKKQKILTKMINKQLKWVNSQVRSGAWSPADGVMLFPDTSSSSFDGKKSDCEVPLKEAFDCDLHQMENQCPENFKPSC